MAWVEVNGAGCGRPHADQGGGLGTAEAVAVASDARQSLQDQNAMSGYVSLGPCEATGLTANILSCSCLPFVAIRMAALHAAGCQVGISRASAVLANRGRLVCWSCQFSAGNCRDHPLPSCT